jgi:phosphoglycolate phosphatase-like HAD superfamily hydrolase
MAEEVHEEEIEEEVPRQKEARPIQQEYERPEKPESERPATNVLELLDRILDKGVVIVGDIRISVADIELLKIQIRLLIASVDKAKELGIDFAWAREIEQTKSKDELENKVKELEDRLKEKGTT